MNYEEAAKQLTSIAQDALMAAEDAEYSCQMAIEIWLEKNWPDITERDV